MKCSDMSCGRAWAVALLAVAALVPVSAAEADERTTVLLRYECRSEVARREMTLFANGTIRLQERDPDGERMSLGELTREQTRAYLDRLREIDLSEVDRFLGRMEGDWVERCDLELQLPDMEPKSFRFAGLDTLSLGLARLLHIVEELETTARMADAGETLPPGYEPEPGDRLLRVDGGTFEVVGLTADGLGVELQGVDIPLTVFISKGDLRRKFVSLESRRRPVRDPSPE